MTATNSPNIGQRVWINTHDAHSPVASGEIVAVVEDDWLYSLYVTIDFYDGTTLKTLWGGGDCFETEQGAIVAAIKEYNSLLSVLIDKLQQLQEVTP